jgi:membrane-bound inhibitor of C-type lysozyme
MNIKKIISKTLLTLALLTSANAFAAAPVVTTTSLNTIQTLDTNGNGQVENGDKVKITYDSGITNYKATFDGMDDYISVSDTSGLSYGANAFSMSIWTKITDIGGGFKVLFGYGSASNNQSAWIGRSGSTIQGGFYGANTVSFDSTVSANDSFWMTLVSDGTNIEFYKDGVSQGTISAASQNLVADKISIGRQVNGADEFWTGEARDARIYNRALNSSEVGDIVAGNAPTNGLVREYLLNEMSGTSVNDSSSFNADGVTNDITESTFWAGNIQASADLSDVGGSASQALNDRGTSGDTTSGDGIWSYEYTATSVVSGSTASISVSAINADSTTTLADDLILYLDKKPARLSSFSDSVDNTSEDTEVEITFDELKAKGDEFSGDALIDGFKVISTATGTLKIGASSPGNAFIVGSNDVIDSTNNAYWTPASSATGDDQNAFKVVVKDTDGDTSSDGSIVVQIDVANADNDMPTLSTFTQIVATGSLNTELEITYAALLKYGDEADIDSTITSFIVKNIDTGTLKIGNSSATATVYSLGSNDTINASNNAYWTPVSGVTGTLNAFDVVVKSDDESATRVQVQAEIKSGTVVDVSANKISASLTNDLDSDVKVDVNDKIKITYNSGITNYKATFDGMDDYISVSDTSGLSYGANAFSMSIWTKITDIGGGFKVLFGYGSASPNQSAWIGRSGSTIQGGFYGANTVSFDSTVSANDSFWMTLVSDGTNIKFYKDGVSQGTISAASQNLAANKISIGRQVNGADEFWTGEARDARIYNRALSSSEVGDIVAGNAPTNGLVREYLLNEMSGTSVNDSSSFNADGVTNDITESTFWAGNIQASADLSDVGGSASQALNDRGTSGDTTSGDGIWSYEYTATSVVSGSTASISVSVINLNGTATSFDRSLAIDTVGYSLTVTAIADDSGFSGDYKTNDINGITISGTNDSLPAGYTIKVSIDDGNTWSSDVVSGSTWSYTDANTRGNNNAANYIIAIKDGSDNIIKSISQVVGFDNASPTLNLDASGDYTATSTASTVSLDDDLNPAVIDDGSQVEYKQLQITISGVVDGADEQISLDVDKTLEANFSATAVTLSGISNMDYSYTQSSGVLLITKNNTSTAIAEADMQTIIRGLDYKNSKEVVTNGNRSFAFNLMDAVGNSVTQTTVVELNRHVLTATSDADTTNEQTEEIIANTDFNITDVETNTIKTLTFTFSNIENFTDEKFTFDGSLLAFTNGNSGTTSGNSYAYSISSSGTNATLTYTLASQSIANTITRVKAASYIYASDNPTVGSARVIKVKVEDDQGLFSNEITLNTITVRSISITSSTYDHSNGNLVVTGTGFYAKSGADNDIDADKFTFTGENNDTYQLTDTADVEITNSTTFTLVLSSVDKLVVNGLLNKNSTSSDDIVTYNLSAANDYLAETATPSDFSDTINTITVSAFAVPAITSATYNASTGALVVTGTNLVNKVGANNDIDATKFTITGEAGGTYTLTASTTNVEITNSTTFTLNVGAVDKLVINGLLNKDGATADSDTTYSVDVADDWNNGASVAETTNAITVSAFAVPAITSATYDASTGALVVTGTNLVNKVGANNDIDATKFTITGEAGGTYTLTADTANVEIHFCNRVYFNCWCN